MSFFDDEDDAIEEEPRRTSRPAAPARPRGGSGPSRSGPPRRPPARDSAVERRRLIAIGVLIVVVILMILLISSCQASNTRNSLENYNTGVSGLITRSDSTGKQVFSILSSGDGGQTIKQDLATPLQSAKQELADAQSLGVPGQMSAAQSHFVLALQMRVDGISEIAANVGQVSGSGTASTEAVNKIAAGTSRFYASDVTYIDYAASEITQALHGDNITVGGNSNIQVNGGQFLPDLGWLNSTFIATKLGTTLSSGASGGSSDLNTTTPGTHGDGIAAVVVNGNSLSTTGTNTVAATPAPTFVISVTDGGMFTQGPLTCTVSVSGGPSGTAKIAEISAGSTGTCSVPLKGTITTGIFQVTVSISKVPLEANLTNNTASYAVDFQ